MLSVAAGAGAVMALVLVAGFGVAVAMPTTSVGALSIQADDLPEPDIGTEEARRRADKILEDDDYQGPDRSQSPLERFQEWLSDQLEGRFDINPGTGETLSWVVMAIFGGAAIAALVFGLMSLRRSRTGRSSSEEDEVPPEIEVTPLRSADDWAAEADARAAEGDWTEAVRARYRHLTTTLVDRGVLTDLPGRTPGEDRATVAAVLTPAATTLDEISRTYERVWFGRHDATASDAEAVRVGSQRVIALAPRRSARDGADDGQAGDRGVAVRSLDREATTGTGASR